MMDSRNWFPTIPPSRQRHFLASQRHAMLIEINGQKLHNFASNDYLGLSVHGDVKNAAIDAIKNEGFGSGASRLVSGDDPVFHAFESELAAWKGFEACLLVGSGMLANIGLLQALSDRSTEIFADKLNHASLVDGCRLSEAKVKRYPHLDYARLEKQLQQNVNDNTKPKRMIVSDGVFSMDGDGADITILMDLANRYDALLIVDDAHGTGTVGQDGKGLIAQAGLSGHARLIEVGTLGKAFGSYGAYVLGSAEMIHGLRQRMRTVIYSTAIPVSAIAAARTALDIIQTTDVVQQLQANVAYFLECSQHLQKMPSQTAIQPVLLGSDEAALNRAKYLRDSGFFVPAIRPPTVPEGTARLRITLSAQHTKTDIDGLVQALTL
ncbi:MAG: 8-amino-7-oxononanoate synthase [Zetaproteobacteria bacterium CG2_30_46_52]|nr:MAG: 8-amino-7-oxononanoate synthase [Zetaproteobacteria bacterium CG2_30_46_52]